MTLYTALLYYSNMYKAKTWGPYIVGENNPRQFYTYAGTELGFALA